MCGAHYGGAVSEETNVVASTGASESETDLRASDGRIPGQQSFSRNQTIDGLLERQVFATDANRLGPVFTSKRLASSRKTMEISEINLGKGTTFRTKLAC